MEGLATPSSLTNTSDPRKTMYFPKFDWPRIDNPYLSFPINDEVIESVKSKEDLAVSQILEAVKNHKNKIAGLIIEPIQGEEEIITLDVDFFRNLEILQMSMSFY